MLFSKKIILSILCLTAITVTSISQGTNSEFFDLSLDELMDIPIESIGAITLSDDELFNLSLEELMEVHIASSDANSVTYTDLFNMSLEELMAVRIRSKESSEK